MFQNIIATKFFCAEYIAYVSWKTYEMYMAIQVENWKIQKLIPTLKCYAYANFKPCKILANICITFTYNKIKYGLGENIYMFLD